VRIAAQRSTISTLATAPEISSKPTGASFLEVLAGTSVQSSAGNVASTPSSVQQRDSDASDQNNQQQPAAQAQEHTQNQAPAKTDPVQTAVAQVTPRSNAVPVITSQPQAQVRSSASGSSRTAERTEKTPAVSAAPAVNVTLPAPVALPVIVPVAVPPIPSPSPSVQSDDNTGTQKSETAVGAAEVQVQLQVQPQDSDNHAARTEHIVAGNGQDNNQNASATQDTKPAAESSNSTDDAPVQSGNPLTSSTACATAFSLPAGITPVALPISSATLSAADFLPGMSDVSSLSANTMQNSKTGAAGFAKSATTNTAATNGTNQAAPSTAPASASARNAPNTVQNTAQSTPAGQHAQSQPAQAAPAAQAQANSIAPQIQAIAGHGTAHDVNVSHVRADGSAETAHASEQPAQAEVSESAGTSGINTANVIQKMSDTEMHVGMHSAEFGDISIRTSVSQQQMTAQISVDHGDLGKAISEHIPAMEAKFGGEFGLRALVQVSQSGMSFSGDRGYSAQREQRPAAQPAQVEGIPAFVESDSAAPRVAAVAGDGYRLDIRA
jgi:hypothetical protein